MDSTPLEGRPTTAASSASSQSNPGTVALAAGTPVQAARTSAARPSGLLRPPDFDRLVTLLQARGFEVVAPTIADGAIVLAVIASASELPAGWTSEQAPGRYRLRPRADAALFAHGPAANSCRSFLRPPCDSLFTARRSGTGFRIETGTTPAPRYAFLGVRACDLAAVARLDRVLLGDRFRDSAYEARRAGAFFAVADCREPAATCFCASMGGGPVARDGFDLRLTEIPEGDHRVLAQAGSDEGAAVLEALAAEQADDTTHALAAVPPPASERSLPMDGLRERLYAADRPHWQEVAARCLACANCTMVCPTCFCTTVEDGTDVTLEVAERRRRWDSCFTLGFSYIHGGSVRATTVSRYRQWLLHKLATWQDQFGTPGCVGCGRCITWCPAGIDITEEARAVAGAPAPTTGGGGA